MARSSRGIDRRSALVTFVLGGWVSAELGWIIQTENKRADFDRQSKADIRMSHSIIERSKKGEKVDVEKEMLGKFDEKEDTPVDAISSGLDAIDTKWSEAVPSIKPPPPQRSSDAGSKGGWL